MPAFSSGCGRMAIKTISTCSNRFDRTPGDTEVVNRGHGDKVFITTSGIGVFERDTRFWQTALAPATRSFSAAISAITASLSSRSEFEGAFQSDCAALNGLVNEMLEEAELAGSVDGIRCVRDPTRRRYHAQRNREPVEGRHGCAGKCHSPH